MRASKRPGAEQRDLGGGLHAQVERRDGATAIVLSGKLTELATMDSLLELPDPIRIDLEGVDHINSLGVRSWVNFVRDAEAKGLNLTFERCSPTIVSQISMISTFIGKRSRVKSIFVVYVCPSCDSEHLHLTEVEHGKQLQVPTTMPCAKCQSTMRVDEVSTYSNLFAEAR